MPATAAKKCFVIMPFGTKPITGEGGAPYDFDKVYRVIIRRAVTQAGLEPIRADERKGSSLIHVDMFKDLRDQGVVLADLSLHNPNVFYELGIRHVMSPGGTVLMCRSGADLPFDVKLSRVVFYKYDGQALDWDEAERVVKELEGALGEALAGKPDSPVHALLEPVLPERSRGAARKSVPTVEGGAAWEPLDAYQKLIADYWARQGTPLADLQKQHGGSVFGRRALGHFCLAQRPMPREAPEVAHALYSVEQYDLANRIYATLEAAGELDVRCLLTYGSSISEAEETVSGAERGLGYQMQALDLVKLRQKGEPSDSEAPEDLARCYHMLAGLSVWKWQLTRAGDGPQPGHRSAGGRRAALRNGGGSGGILPPGTVGPDAPEADVDAARARPEPRAGRSREPLRRDHAAEGQGASQPADRLLPPLVSGDRPGRRRRGGGLAPPGAGRLPQRRQDHGPAAVRGRRPAPVQLPPPLHRGLLARPAQPFAAGPDFTDPPGRPPPECPGHVKQTAGRLRRAVTRRPPRRRPSDDSLST
jgi:hypothetical protein